MSDFDYKKYLAEGGIEAKLQENSVNEESVDEGVFGDIGKGIGGVATGIGAGVGATMAGAGVLGFAALEFLISLVVITALGLVIVGKSIFNKIQNLNLSDGIVLGLMRLLSKGENKTLKAVVNRLKDDPEILEYVNNPSKRGLRNTVLSKLNDEEKAEIGTYIKNSFSRRDLDK